MSLSKQMNDMVQVNIAPISAGANDTVSPSAERFLDNVIGGISHDQTLAI